MPRIDPSQLLRTLSVLLAKDGGIRSAEEVVTIKRIVGIYLHFFFVGAQDCAVNAKIFQEIGVEMYLHSHPMFKQPRITGELFVPKGLGPPELLVLRCYQESKLLSLW